MQYTPKEYKKKAKSIAARTRSGKNFVMAFLVGGAICSLGQVFISIYQDMLGYSQVYAQTLASISLILLSVILTSVNLYDNIAVHAGAGTLVPITGFANAMSSAAIGNRTEGMVLGLGSKMFVIAGPVIVYGTVASVIYGIIYYIIK